MIWFDQDNAIGTDSKMAVTQQFHMGCIEHMLQVSVIDHNKVIAGTVVLGKCDTFHWLRSS
jgi:hypothetical protein